MPWSWLVCLNCSIYVSVCGRRSLTSPSLTIPISLVTLRLILPIWPSPYPNITTLSLVHLLSQPHSPLTPNQLGPFSPHPCLLWPWTYSTSFQPSLIPPRPHSTPISPASLLQPHLDLCFVLFFYHLPYKELREKAGTPTTYVDPLRTGDLWSVDIL